MGKPQQPELHRSGHTPVDADHAAEVAERAPAPRAPGRSRSVPPENRPGHHPEVEQDRPRRPPNIGRKAGAASAPVREPLTPRARFPFEFDPWLAALAAPFGVIPSRAFVTVGDSELVIRFGPWALRTPLSNLRAITPSGPYAWWKVAGPPRISLADGGITFATTAARGLCLTFHEPVPALLPTPMVRHPAATITVASPKAFAEAVATRTGHTLPSAPSS